METKLVDPRQYVSDASGRVLVSPVGDPSVRVPVYGAAKPVSATTASAKAHRADGQRLLAGKRQHAWTSLVSVLQLGATSGTLPAAPGQAGGCVAPNRARR